MIQIFRWRAANLNSAIAMHTSPVRPYTWQSSIALGTHPWCVDGVFRNLRITIDAPGTGKSWTFTLYKNGSPTALTLTISDTSTYGENTTDSVTVADGDTLTLHAVVSPSIVSAGNPTGSIEFQSTNTGESGHGGHSGTTSLSASASYAAPISYKDFSAFNLPSVVAVDGAITAYRILLSAAPGSGNTRSFAFRVNGVTQDGTGGTVDTRVSIADAATTASASFTLPVSAGDTLDIIHTLTSGSSTTTRVGIAVKFLADTDGESNVNAITESVAANVVRYTSTLTLDATSWNATESNLSFPETCRAWTFRRLYQYVNNVWGRTVTFTLRKNATDTAVTGTASASGVTTIDGVDEVAVADGDALTFRVDSPTGGFSRSPVLAYAMYIETPGTYETVTVTDVVQAALDPLPLSVFDVVTVTDVAQLPAVNATASDNVTLSENVAASLITVDVALTVNDAVTLSDSTSTEMQLRLSVAETVTVSDTQLSFPLALTPSYDRVYINESVTLLVPNLAVHAHESVTVVDPTMYPGEGPSVSPEPSPPPGSTLQDYWIVGIT